MKKTLLISSIAAALCLSAGPALADFYKYVDKDGVIHITNVPTSRKFVWIMRESRVLIPRDKSVTGRKDFEDLIYLSSRKYGVDPMLVKAIVKAESDFDHMAVSEDGARGLMQLMPETARMMGVRDIHDPEENVEGGIRYLSSLLRMFSWDVRLAVAAYNAGENAVLRYGSVPPYPETRNYVKKVLAYYNSFRQ